jgi:hypothetical protein
VRLEVAAAPDSEIVGDRLKLLANALGCGAVRLWLFGRVRPNLAAAACTEEYEECGDAIHIYLAQRTIKQ